MSTLDISSRRLAVLIDGDNAQPSLLNAVLEEASRNGTLTIRRIYGDWTSPQMGSWKMYLQGSAVQPVQQFHNTKGKNSTDSAMIIDAMDILHSGAVDGIVIVSSDSDYTRLATRFREAGMFVMGIGERKTPEALVKACELFVYTENLESITEDDKGITTPSSKAKNSTSTKRGTGKAAKLSSRSRKGKEVLSLINKAYDMVEGEEGWAHLAQLGITVHKLDPAFDPRTYGYRKIIDIIEDFNKHFEVKRIKEMGPGAVYIRRLDK